MCTYPLGGFRNEVMIRVTLARGNRDRPLGHGKKFEVDRPEIGETGWVLRQAPPLLNKTSH